MQEDTHSLDIATANYRQVYHFGHMAVATLSLHYRQPLSRESVLHYYHKQTCAHSHSRSSPTQSVQTLQTQFEHVGSLTSYELIVICNEHCG